MLFWLGVLCSSIVGLVVLAFAGLTLRFYLAFRRTPQKGWRDRFVKLWITAQKRTEREHALMERAALQDEAEDHALREDIFRQFLCSISVDELEAYPGIGPATIARLRETGCKDLAALQDGLGQLAGLGQKRLEDVRAAVGHLLEEARSRFDAGACPEASELTARLELQRAFRSEAGARAALRFLALGNLLLQLEPLLPVAEAITLTTYMQHLSGQGDLPALPREPLPDLEQVLRSADERFGQVAALVEQGVGPKPGISEVPSRRARRAAVGRRGQDLFCEALQACATARPSLQSPGLPPIPQTPSNENLPLAYLQWTVQFALAVARVDGRPARKELAVIDEYLERRWGDDRALLNRAKALAAEYEKAPLDQETCLDGIVRCCTEAERQELLDLAHAIVDATGERNQRETAFLEQVAARLFPKGRATSVSASREDKDEPSATKAPGSSSHEERLAMLEIELAAPLSADLIRRQFNLLADRYAAEKFSAFGPEFVATAKGKLEAIRAAATALLEELGEQLDSRPPAPVQDLRHNPDLDAMFGA